MNLSESMKLVLKTRVQSILTEFLKSDLKSLIVDIKDDFVRLSKSRPKNSSDVKKGLIDFKDATVDALAVLRAMPKRVVQGFAQFRDDFLTELEKLDEPKEKTIFCVKVIGALTSLTVGTVYGIRKVKTDFSYPGMRRGSAFTQFLIKELVMRMSQLFILRFLTEVEREVTDPEELKKLKFFRRMLTQNEEEGFEDSPQDPNDPAFEIVDSLKRFLVTGQ